MRVGPIVAFAVAWFDGAVLATLVNSAGVLSGLAQAGAELRLGDILGFVGADLVGLGPRLAALLLVAFAVAFPVAGLVGRLTGLSRSPGVRIAGFAVAGFCAVLALVWLATHVFFGINPFAGARGPVGLAALSLAGAAAGAIYALLTAPPPGKRAA